MPVVSISCRADDLSVIDLFRKAARSNSQFELDACAGLPNPAAEATDLTIRREHICQNENCKAARALNPGGQLIVLEQLAGRAPLPMGNTINGLLGLSYFHLLQCWLCSSAEVSHWFHEAGFSMVRRINLLKAAGARLIIGAKAQSQHISWEGGTCSSISLFCWSSLLQR